MLVNAPIRVSLAVYVPIRVDTNRGVAWCGDVRISGFRERRARFAR